MKFGWFGHMDRHISHGRRQQTDCFSQEVADQWITDPIQLSRSILSVCGSSTPSFTPRLPTYYGKNEVPLPGFFPRSTPSWEFPITPC